MTEVLTQVRAIWRDKGGAIGIVFALALLVAMSFMGAAIDYASASRDAVMMQSAADAAALAGAEILSNGGTTQTASATASSLATANLKLPIAVTPSIVVGSSTVSVTLSATYPTAFMRAVGIKTVPIAKTSKANVGTGTSSSGAALCIMALDPSMDNAFEASGGTQVVANGCSVQVNSKSSKAVTFSGNSTLTSGKNCFVGGISQGASLMTPTPITGCAAAADPFATYAAPAYGTCTHTNYTVSGGSPVLYPGVYCGGLTLSSVTTATLQPGVYVIKDGLFKMQGGGALQGNGVALMLTGNGAGLDWSGGGSYHLVAPSSGTLAGFVVYLDPAATPASKSVISGTGAMYYEGILYFAKQQIEVSGTGMTQANASPWSIYIANNFVYSGTSQLVVNANASKTSVYIPPALGVTSGSSGVVLSQ